MIARQETEVYAERPFLTRVETTEIRIESHHLVTASLTLWICEHAHWHRDRGEADQCNLLPQDHRDD